MALFINGRAPKAIRIGETPITRVMLGEHLVFDGTVPAISVTLPKAATATATAAAPTGRRGSIGVSSARDRGIGGAPARGDCWSTHRT